MLRGPGRRRRLGGRLLSGTGSAGTVLQARLHACISLAEQSEKQQCLAPRVRSQFIDCREGSCSDGASVRPVVRAHNGGPRKREDPKALPLVGSQEAKLPLMSSSCLQHDQAVCPSQVEIRVKTER